MAFQSAATLRPLLVDDSPDSRFYSLAMLEEMGLGAISRLPHFDTHHPGIGAAQSEWVGSVQEHHLRQLAGWQPNGERSGEGPIRGIRIVAPDSAMPAAGRPGSDAGRRRPARHGAWGNRTLVCVSTWSSIIPSSSSTPALAGCAQAEHGRRVRAQCGKVVRS